MLSGMGSQEWLGLACESSEGDYQVEVFLNFGARFPLYSIGVDTYRFEYGVFLLNKNIEIVSSAYLLETED